MMKSSWIFDVYPTYIQAAWSRILWCFCDIKSVASIRVTYFCDCNVMTDVRPLRHLRSASFPRLLPLVTRAGTGFRLAFETRDWDHTKWSPKKCMQCVSIYMCVCVWCIYIYIIYWLEGFESLLVCQVHCNWNSKASQLCSFGTGLAFAGLATQ